MAHPDSRFVNYIVGGTRAGFRVGFHHNHCCVKVKTNMRSAWEHPEIIHDYLYIAKESVEGRILGPFSLEVLPELQISWLGVIPK